MHHRPAAPSASRRSLRKRLLKFFIVIALLLLAAAFACIPTAVHAADVTPPPGVPSVSAAGFPALDAAWEQSLAAIVVADQAYLPGPGLYTVTAFDTYRDHTGDWALAVIVPAAVVDAGWENFDLDQLVDVLLQRTPDGTVTGHVRPHPAFPDLAQRVPRQLVDYSPLLASAMLGPNAQLQAAEAIDYRFPWTAGQTWWLGSTWHAGYGPDAVDFSPLTADNPPVNSAVLAAAGGTLRMACQNDQEQRLLWIDHPNGERTGYLHLDRASVGEAVEDQNLVGQVVPQGIYLGQVYRGEAKTDGQCPAGFPACTFNTLCGYGNAPHVHFLAPNRTITIDGFNIGALGAGQAGSRFISTNVRGGVLPDTQPPTAWLTAPISGSITISPGEDRLQVTIAATDALTPARPAGQSPAVGAAPSGVAGVAVQLAWQAAGGSWQLSPWVDAALAGQDTYTATLATCSLTLRVPHNRPLRLSLRATDKAGNQAQVDAAGIYRFDHPDVDGDCAVGLHDLLDVLAAIAGRIPPQPDHDVDDDGILTPADATLLANHLQEVPPPGSATSRKSHLQEVPPLPGSVTVTFTPLPSPAGLSLAQSVAVTGTTAYVTDWRSGNLAAIEAADPTASTMAAGLPLGNRIYGAATLGSLVYVADPRDNGSRLWVLGAGEAITPTLVASTTVPGEVMQPLSQSGVVSDLLYLAAGSAGLHVVDVTHPSTPTLLSTLDTPGSATAVALLDHLDGQRIALVADRQDGLQVVDVDDPAHPQLLATLDTPGTAIGVTAAMTGSQAIAVVADGLAGLHVVDITNTANPKLLAAYATVSAGNNVLLHGSLLYAAAGWQGVIALDVSDLRAPRRAGSYDTPGYAYHLELLGDELFVADGAGGLQVLRVAIEQGPSHAVLIPLAGKDIAP